MVDSEIKLEEAAVLHYTYAKFNDLTSRRDRCGCKPTKDDVKRCFMLEFDRAVSFLHLHASTLIKVYIIRIDFVATTYEDLQARCKFCGSPIFIYILRISN